MTKNLVIVFVKNIKLGTVKTRLAKTIGNQGAFDVYKALVDLTEKATTPIKADKRVYFSNAIVDEQWQDFKKFVQKGDDLGTRMKNAFKKGFEDGYERIVIIGSDLPDITTSHLEKGLQALKTNDVVLGPAIDGGYYLIGQTKNHDFIFDNMPWSASHLLETTFQKLKSNNVTFETLETLNDIDTIEDLEASRFYQNNYQLQEKIKLLR